MSFFGPQLLFVMSCLLIRYKRFMAPTREMFEWRYTILERFFFYNLFSEMEVGLDLHSSPPLDQPLRIVSDKTSTTSAIGGNILDLGKI